MKKQFLFFAVAALALASCSSENDVVQTPDVQQTAADEIAVNFDAYLNRSTTRAGRNGVINNPALRDSEANGGGFGVFGYYTNGESYTGSSRPDFFYNQGVFYSDGNKRWEYTPIKYWPNEFGNDAISDQVDKVTLFAYAPYVKVEPLTGLVKGYDAPENAINITGMTRNNATGDPLVKYVSSLISNHSVDLCYGVAKNNFTSSNSSFNPNDIKVGKPYIDVVKPGTDADSKIYFDFKHALAQLNVTIDAKVVDWTSGNPATTVENKYTRIWVRSISFEGITQSGALNLNSEAGSPNWYDVNGTSLITTGSLTVYDGRKDGREANEASSSETPSTLNPIIIQSETYPASPNNFTTKTELTAGVTETTVNLFAAWDGTGNKYVPAVNTTDPIFVIPTKEKMKITIVYDVETADDNLATYLSDGSRRGSTIENRIYKTIDTFGYIEAGKRYTLNLHLGMRTVDFDADVTDWLDYNTDVDLPSNLQTFEANAPQTNATVKLGNEATTYSFAVSGLKAGASVTPTTTGLIETTPYSYTTPVIVNGAGIGTCDMSGWAKNLTPNNIELGTIKLYDGSKAAELTITQLASPLGLSTSSTIAENETDITLSATKATGTGNDDWNAAAAADKIIVKRGNTPLSKVASFATDPDVKAGQYTFADGVITLGAGANKGDIYTITITVGDAPQETVTVNCPNT